MAAFTDGLDDFFDEVNATKSILTTRQPYALVTIRQDEKPAVRDEEDNITEPSRPAGHFTYKYLPPSPGVDPRTGEPLWRMEPETFVDPVSPKGVPMFYIAVRTHRIHRKFFRGGKLLCESMDGVVPDKDNPFSATCKDCRMPYLKGGGGCNRHFEILGVDQFLRPVVLDLSNSSGDGLTQFMTDLSRLTTERRDTEHPFVPWGCLIPIRVENFVSKGGKTIYRAAFPAYDKLAKIKPSDMLSEEETILVKERLDPILRDFYMPYAELDGKRKPGRLITAIAEPADDVLSFPQKPALPAYAANGPQPRLGSDLFKDE